MKFIDFNAVVANAGQTARERNLNKAKSDYTKLAKENPSFKTVLIDDVARSLTIYAATMENKKYICSVPGERFEIGNIVTYLNGKYIILRADVDDEVYCRGYMERCNWELKWQNEDTDIVTCDCEVLTASQYNTGEYAIKTITIGSNQFAINIPLNDETIKLKPGKRFFIDNNKENPIPYRLTRVDTVSASYYGVGCISLILTEDQYNATTDSVEYGLCDYTLEPIYSHSKVEISYIGEPKLVCGGTAKTFKSNIPVMFSLTMNLDDLGLKLLDVIEVIQITDYSCKIRCKKDDRLIGKVLKVTYTEKVPDGAPDGYKQEQGEFPVDIISNV